ncbi:MFS transporter [Desmospora profundinema]|uniref:EmrB/QacA subfamily drug resistance transporter n=1 Tax=Desmospora profundinema TaxID=1571184 RepID=A0ABU1ING9_9BACL|nr:MFS transporter [Desmospora profundinema]MDR6226087.1 EmrB/QacA subfamily drug resistance transporter [Desmospora profundinema]
MSPFKRPDQTFTNTHRFFMMTAICMGAFLSHFTAGIVNVSLPHFVEIFQTNLSTVQWITTGYLLVIASALPVMGKLGDRYGYGLIHNLGYVLFSTGSILVAFSSSIAELLVLRIVQAIGAAMFQATNIALVTIYLPKEKRGWALGTISTAVALGGMSGPIAGGFIAEWLHWQWLFLIHVPVAIVATWLAVRSIPVHRRERKNDSFDPMGALLFVGWIASAIFILSNGHTWGWLSFETLAIAAGAIFTLLMFLLWELKQTAPFLPLQALRIPAVSSGLIISGVSFAMAHTVLVVMPFYLLGIAGLSPSATGYIMTAYPVLLALTGPVAGYLSDRYGSLPLLFLGLCGMGGGMALLALALGRLPLVWIVFVLAWIGGGMGLIASPNNRFIMLHAPAEHVGSIGGMIALTRNGGMVLGAAIGLGAMNQEAGAVPSLDRFQLAFAINGWMCISVILLLGYVVYSEHRRNEKRYKKLKVDPMP